MIVLSVEEIILARPVFSLFTATQILTAEIVQQNDINSLLFAIKCGILYSRTGR